jgi:hypothetical protein
MSHQHMLFDTSWQSQFVMAAAIAARDGGITFFYFYGRSIQIYDEPSDSFHGER